jgi:hypothetical protein
MTNHDKRILESLSDAEFPLLAKLLRTEARPFLLQELRQLVARRWSDRAPRSSVDVLGRLRGTGVDQAVLVRNISHSGVLLEVESPQGLPAGSVPLKLLLQTEGGLVELPMEVARVERGIGKEIAFEFADRASQLAANGLQNLYFGAMAADT